MRSASLAARARNTAAVFTRRRAVWSRPVILVNAPPPVHERVAAVLAAAGEGAQRARHVVVSGVVPSELEAVARGYAAAGWAVAVAREQDGWAAALLEPGDA